MQIDVSENWMIYLKDKIEYYDGLCCQKQCKMVLDKVFNEKPAECHMKSSIKLGGAIVGLHALLVMHQAKNVALDKWNWEVVWISIRWDLSFLRPKIAWLIPRPWSSCRLKGMGKEFLCYRGRLDHHTKVVTWCCRVCTGFYSEWTNRTYEPS